MKPDKKYEVIKEIPLNGGSAIKKGSVVFRTHGVYYLDGGLLPKDYQQDFDALIEKEQVTGWNYLCPVVEKTAFKNNKEEL